MITLVRRYLAEGEPGLAPRSRRPLTSPQRTVQTHAGTDILVLVHDRHIRVLTADGELPRELHLDPSKDYQPQPTP